MFEISTILHTLRQGFSLAFEYWWIWLPLVLGDIVYNAWMEYQQEKYIAGQKWVMVEVIPPPEILYSSPKAAESFFASLHATYGGGVKWKEQMFGGKIPDAFSLELVSNGGETHFYIRCTENHRNTLEALLFAQYPQAEIRPVEDYINLLPEKFDPVNYDIAGSDFVFTQPAPFPIKNFVEFEEGGGKDEYARLDPLAPLFEIMSALGPGEHLWLQYVMRPTGGDWVKEGAKVVDKLAGREKPAETPLLMQIVSAPFALLEAVLMDFGIGTPAEEKKEEKKQFNLQSLTPAEKLVLEHVQYKLSKLAFKVAIRVFYAARRDAFNGARPASVTAMFKQLFYNNLNSFKPGAGTKDKGIAPWMFPGDKGFFVAERVLAKKNAFYKAYRTRSFSKKPTNPKEFPIILNSDELATLWHMPALNVKAPMLPRVTAKKGTPPAILPTR